MGRISQESVDRNRELQRKRNEVNNEKRSRSFGRLDSDIRRLERRPFVGWDGEGYRIFAVDSTGEVEVLHRFMLFGSSTGHYVSGPNVGTVECLDLILYVEQQYPDAFHVGFVFEYDANMILKDLSWRHLAMLYDTGQVKWKGYRIKHTPHKMFCVSKNGISATIYDVFGFFHSSYLKALRTFGIGTSEQLARIEAGKKQRSHFTYCDLPMVTQYWSEEIGLLPMLMDSLRESCYSAGFYLTQWHGPGALASFALKKYGVSKWKAKHVPIGVQIARRYAYAGGRFQCWRAGHWRSTAYTADINSAYAYACSQLPRLDNGTWEHNHNPSVLGPRDIKHFALYRIRFDASELEQSQRTHHIPFPLFNRDSRGYLTWPAVTEGWYWSPEAATVAGSKYAKFLEVWEYHDDGTRPFAFVQGAYDRRLSLQDAGDPVEKAYKWFLASIYGAFAQRVGWDRVRHCGPRFHQLEWAGYITSYCRALVFRASIDIAKRGGLVSIDTDGITSTVPFNNESLPGGGVGTGLGQWKLESFSELLQWQNGIYWLKKHDGKWKDAKTRGVPRGVVDRQSALDTLSAIGTGAIGENPCIHITRTRFIGYRQAMQHQFTTWRQWRQEPVDIEFGGSGKGRHVSALCDRCTAIRGGTDADKIMHTIVHQQPSQPDSNPHKLPWLIPEKLPELNVKDKGIWEDSMI